MVKIVLKDVPESGCRLMRGVNEMGTCPIEHQVIMLNRYQHGDQYNVAQITAIMK